MPPKKARRSEAKKAKAADSSAHEGPPELVSSSSSNEKRKSTSPVISSESEDEDNETKALLKELLELLNSKARLAIQHQKDQKDQKQDDDNVVEAATMQLAAMASFTGTGNMVDGWNHEAEDSAGNMAILPYSVQDGANTDTTTTEDSKGNMVFSYGNFVNLFNITPDLLHTMDIGTHYTWSFSLVPMLLWLISWFSEGPMDLSYALTAVKHWKSL